MRQYSFCGFLLSKVFNKEILNFLVDTCPLVGHWYPCFRFLVVSSLDGKYYSHLAEAQVMYVH